MRKKSLSTALLALLTASAYAQGGDGIAGITEATSMVTSYFYPLVQLIYAIGAVTGLIGGIRVYQKFSSGDPDTWAAAWSSGASRHNISSSSPPGCSRRCC